MKALGSAPDKEAVRDFLMMRVGDRLYQSLASIVDDYIDDTPKQGEAFSDENRERARREISRLARVLAHPDYVARFDGGQHGEERELRRENFNRPYAPLVLLVSKVGEEGIDLQQHTRYVLHYDVNADEGGRLTAEERKKVMIDLRPW